MAEELVRPLLWIAPAGIALGGTVLISLIQRRAARRSLLILWALLPLLAFIALGVSDGCIPSTGMDRCYWVGFGLILLIMFGLPIWWGAIIVGLVAAHFRRKRKAP